VRAFHGEALARQEFTEQAAQFGVVIHQQDMHG
jgi:hypothetical protein